MVHPRAVVMVYRHRSWRQPGDAGRRVHGTEIVLRIDPDPCNHCRLLYGCRQSLAVQHLGRVHHDGAGNLLTMLVDKVQAVVIIQQVTVQAEAGVYPEAEAGGDSTAVFCRCCSIVDSYMRTLFHPHKRSAGDDVIHRADYLHVRVKV